MTGVRCLSSTAEHSSSAGTNRKPQSCSITRHVRVRCTTRVSSWPNMVYKVSAASEMSGITKARFGTSVTKKINSAEYCCWMRNRNFWRILEIIFDCFHSRRYPLAAPVFSLLVWLHVLEISHNSCMCASLSLARPLRNIQTELSEKEKVSN